MSKPLSQSELNVLQENLDLFSTTAASNTSTDKARTQVKTSGQPRTPRSRRPHVTRKASHPPTTAPQPTQAPEAVSVPSRSASTSGQQILGVRCTSAVQGRDWLVQQGISVENYAIEKRDPALRNLAEALLGLGLDFRRDDKTLVWFLINSERSSAELLSLESIEIAFGCGWFDEQKSHIRRLKGSDYIDACAAIAAQLSVGIQKASA